jgi:hypothetical protein
MIVDDCHFVCLILPIVLHALRYPPTLFWRCLRLSLSLFLFLFLQPNAILDFSTSFWVLETALDGHTRAGETTEPRNN